PAELQVRAEGVHCLAIALCCQYPANILEGNLARRPTLRRALYPPLWDSSTYNCAFVFSVIRNLFMLELQDIRASLLDISHWRMRSGECWAVLGRNGSGKRQLGQLLAGRLEEYQGSLRCDWPRAELLSFEAQQAFYEEQLKADDTDFLDRLDPGTTVRELLGIDSVPPSLAFLGLERILDRGYRLLSSGESRKALLARALLRQPDLLVLDEPYDSLDQQS